MKTKYFFIIFSVIYVIWNLFYLDKYPIIDLDDACMVEPAWSFVQNGHFSAPTFEGSYGLEKSDIYHGRLHMLSIAPFLKIFGLGTFQARIGSFLTGILVLLLVYLTAKRLFSKSVALKSVILLSLSGLFIICAHRCRQEMLLVLFILLSFYLFLLSVDKKSSPLFFISGLVAGLSADIHLNGVIVPIMLFVLFIYEYKLKAFKEKGFWFCMAGIAIGIMWWIITHILVDPELFFVQWNGFVMKEFGTPGSSLGFNPVKLLANESKRYIAWFWSTTSHRNMVELVLLIIGLSGIAIKRGKNENILITCILTFLVMFTLIVSQKAPYYIFLFFPFLIILVVKGLENIKIGNINLSKYVFSMFVLFYITLMFFISMKYDDVSYNDYGLKVKNFVPPERCVLGDSILWFTFSGQKFYSELSYSYYYKVTKKDLASYLKEKNIEYIVFGKDQIESFVNSGYFKSNYQLVTTLYDEYFGSGGMLKKETNRYLTLVYRKKRL